MTEALRFPYPPSRRVIHGRKIGAVDQTITHDTEEAVELATVVGTLRGVTSLGSPTYGFEVLKGGVYSAVGRTKLGLDDFLSAVTAPYYGYQTLHLIKDFGEGTEDVLDDDHVHLHFHTALELNSTRTSPAVRWEGELVAGETVCLTLRTIVLDASGTRQPVQFYSEAHHASLSVTRIGP